MAYEFEDVKNYGKEQFGAAAAATTCFAKTLQTIATETADYSKKAMRIIPLAENCSAQVLRHRDPDPVRILKTSDASFVSQATKMGELYSSLAKEAFKPVETAVAKVYDGKN
jgi:hypothetical protein